MRLRIDPSPVLFVSLAPIVDHNCLAPCVFQRYGATLGESDRSLWV